MISSTYYDLKQIRADIEDFLSDKLGYNTLLSESHNFPIEPDNDTLQNCLLKVNELADIFILVVGGRYGSIEINSQKSITNLEYLAARKKGIPIYIFVSKHILNTLPLWKDNPDTDFSSIVDNNKLYNFVSSIQDEEKHWVFPFETAQDIIKTLKPQLSYLFNKSLKIKRQLDGNLYFKKLQDLSPSAIKIILEEKKAWEYYLFFQILSDEIEKYSDSIKEYNSNIVIGISEYISANNFSKWQDTRIQEMFTLLESADTLINKCLNEALGPKGESGNPMNISWSAKVLCKILMELINWSLRIRRTILEEPFTELIPVMYSLTRENIEKIIEYPQISIQKLNDTINLTQKQTIHLTLELSPTNFDEFLEKWKKLHTIYIESNNNS